MNSEEYITYEYSLLASGSNLDFKNGFVHHRACTPEVCYIPIMYLCGCGGIGIYCVDQ